jgi:hypothetical protein
VCFLYVDARFSFASLILRLRFFSIAIWQFVFARTGSALFVGNNHGFNMCKCNATRCNVASLNVRMALSKFANDANAMRFVMSVFRLIGCERRNIIRSCLCSLSCGCDRRKGFAVSDAPAHRGREHAFLITAPHVWRPTPLPLPNSTIDVKRDFSRFIHADV